MTRPSLTPMTFHEFDRPKVDRMRQLRQTAAWLLISAARFPLRAVSIAFTRNLLAGRVGKTLPARTVVLGIIAKLAWAVPAVVGACAWIVYNQTHTPRAAAGAGITLAQDVYSERIALTASDGAQLSAVWVPAAGAREVIERGERVLAERRPAVVLVHDHARDAGQMIEHVAALHATGMHVLALDTRGRGRSSAATQTFGHLERLDVAAAVDYLAARPTVDRERIAVWAVGTGARAATMAPGVVPIALLINQRDDDPADLVAQRRPVDVRFLPPASAYDALRPICRWTFHVLFAGGPAVDPPQRPRRMVEVEAGASGSAVAMLREFASDRLNTEGASE